jgi:hypothetical protein
MPEHPSRRREAVARIIHKKNLEFGNILPPDRPENPRRDDRTVKFLRTLRFLRGILTPFREASQDNRHRPIGSKSLEVDFEFNRLRLGDKDG